MSPRAPGPWIGKHLARHQQIAAVLADEGLHAMIDAAGLGRVAPRFRGKAAEVPDSVSSETRIRRALQRLGPTFIKAGQIVSTRTDVISPALATELCKLQDEVPPEPFESARALLESELETSLADAFATFDEVPVAAASLGQVHFATLHDGTEVAVKIQRPDARRQVEVDIDIALTQARWIADHTEIFGKIDVVRYAEEFAEAVREELDYTLEAANAERLWRAFQDDETVAFPQVYWERTTSRILTLERMVGIRMNHVDEIDAAGLDRCQLARRGVGCYLRQMFELGFFHADAHPGNYLALPDGRVAFTDFGRVGRLTDESRDRFVDLVWAAATRDPDLATEALVAVSDNPEIDEVALRRELGRLISKYYGRSVGKIQFGEMFSETLGLIRNHALGVPGDFALVMSTLVVLEGVGTTLDPTVDFSAEAKPYAEKVIRERMSPEVMFDSMSRSWRHAVHLMEALPDTTNRVMRRLSRGEMRMSVRPTGYHDLISEVSGIVNRLVFAIIVGSLVIGFSSLLGVAGAPPWVRVVGQVGLVAAFIVSVWFFAAIIWSYYRGGHKR